MLKIIWIIFLTVSKVFGDRDLKWSGFSKGTEMKYQVFPCHCYCEEKEIKNLWNSDFRMIYWWLGIDQKEIGAVGVNF